VAEEDTEDLGKVGAVARPRGEDHLPVRKHEQRPLVHVLAEEQGAFLGAGGAEVKDLAAEGTKVVRFVARVKECVPHSDLPLSRQQFGDPVDLFFAG
jgi:hypothetical protein